MPGMQEIEDSYGAHYVSREDGIFEITTHQNSESGHIQSQLTDEDKRGTLKFWSEE